MNKNLKIYKLGEFAMMFDFLGGEVVKRNWTKLDQGVQGVRRQKFMFQFALTDRNSQARFGLRVVWES